MLSAYFNGDCYHAYNFIRELVVKDLKNNKLWNLLNLASALVLVYASVYVLPFL